MKLKFFYLFVLSINFILAQQPEKPTSGEIYQNLKALNFLGSVLYIAAHPDDENTRLISYLSNEIHAHTAYLSLTRGDGGQNLIGPEIGEALGLIRTHELLETRKIDGGQQFFTRAIDFGYSKTPDETLNIWNKNQVLADVIWTIRNFKPDVIINRFDHRTSGNTHGHHTASALLSVEAFDKASNKNQFPEQLQFTETWQPKRLFFNTSWWFYGSKENFEKADKSNLISIDIGQFNPLLGLSINEIAANSITQHKSQGFGSTGTRGQQIEYLEFLKGRQPKKESVFDGINTTWSRLENGQQIADILKPLEQSFNFNKPWRIVPELLKARDLINQINDNHWRKLKLKQINLLIKQCLGLFLEAKTSTETAYPGQNIRIDLELINRSPIQVQLESILIENESIKITKELTPNENFKHKIEFKIPNSAEFTSPYWLKQSPKKGLYQVESQPMIGRPKSIEAIELRYNLSINGEKISYQQALVFKTNSPIDGEVYDYFKIVPQVNLSFSTPQLSFNQPETKMVNLTIKSNALIKDAVL
ncbi:MAG: PIG-L family deacetylase, partial [Psychroflexus salarius]